MTLKLDEYSRQIHTEDDAIRLLLKNPSLDLNSLTFCSLAASLSTLESARVNTTSRPVRRPSTTSTMD